MKKDEKKNFEILSKLDTVKIKGGRSQYIEPSSGGGCGSWYVCGDANCSNTYCDGGNCVAGCSIK